MPNLRRRLPPMNSLVVFEAAARRLSFTRAAEELAVSQAAVSRQVATLEQHLNARLFERLHRSLRLTEEGCRLHGAVERALGGLADAAEGIRRQDAKPAVTVFANVAVSTFWLQPRLEALMRAHPALEPHLVASDGDHPPDLAGLDLAVLYGDGHWPHFAVRKLFGEELFPVCSPGYLARHGQPRAPADLAGHTLLHIDQHGPDWINWLAWLRGQGVEPAGALHGPKVNNYAILIDMARQGYGIGLGTRYMVDGLIAEGALIKALDVSLVSERGYFLVHPRERVLAPQAELIRRSLLASAPG